MFNFLTKKINNNKVKLASIKPNLNKFCISLDKKMCLVLEENR